MKKVRPTRSVYKIFLGLLIKKGKITIAQRIITNMYLDLFKKKGLSFTKTTGYLLNAAGVGVEIRTKRVGKQIYTIPFPTSIERSKYISLKNFINSANKDKKKEPTYKRYSVEVMKEVLKRPTQARIQAESIYKVAFLNSANRHYRWK